MRNDDRDNRITKPRRGPHVWFFATLGGLGLFTLIALLFVDPHHRLRIGIVAGMAALFLTAHWLILNLRTIDEKDQWLDTARRHDERAEDECEVYYVDLGEAQSPTGAMAPKRFQLGTSRSRAELLAAVITGIWNRHGKEWTPNALEQIAAAFRADDDELTRIAVERAAAPTDEVQIQVLKTRRD